MTRRDRKVRTARNAGLALSAALLAAAVRVLQAGDWHSGDHLVCSDCHTMHNSFAGQPMRYDNDPSPAPRLLRHATSLSLCVYCHDGSSSNVPDVVAPVGYIANPNGGSFQSPFGQSFPTGHDLAVPSGTVPPGGSTAMTLTCLTCHDPHGSASYRNLKADPSGGAGSFPVTAAQTVLPNGSNPALVYLSTNVLYKAGMSAWCGACHGQFHGRTAAEEGTSSPWFRHPQDQAISASAHTDYPYWAGAVPNRVPVQSPNDDTVPSNDDQVFCLSCHKAHGSANRAALVFADGATPGSTCQQCHNK